MKLYTEEQLMKAIELAKYCEYDCGGVYFDFNLDSILLKLTPIELPSDEEIENYARQSGLVHQFITMGAKWMRNKIQGGKQ
jgi:hypothetical protein